MCAVAASLKHASVQAYNIRTPNCNQKRFLPSSPRPVISCYLLFYNVVVTSLYTWQLFSLRLISPPQHQSCYFRAMLGKHSHDGAWTPWPQAAKRLLTAHIAHNNYASNKPRSICCRTQNHVLGRDGYVIEKLIIIAHLCIRHCALLQN